MFRSILQYWRQACKSTISYFFPRNKLLLDRGRSTTSEISTQCTELGSFRRNIDWKPGVNQPTPFSHNSWTCFDPTVLSKAGGLYGLMISAVVPRPIALITSHNKAGVQNCAPFSYFNVVCHDPPILVIGCCLKGSVKKDTLVNVEETGEFVVNIMSSWFAESANHSCGMFPPEVDEVEVSGMTTIPSVVVSPPRIAESAVQFECQVYDTKPIHNDEGKHTTTLVYGRVVRIHVHDGVLVRSEDVAGPAASSASTASATTATTATAANVAGSDTNSNNNSNNSNGVNLLKPTIDFTKLKPLGRLGGDTYTIVNNGFDLKRPKV